MGFQEAARERRFAGIGRGCEEPLQWGPLKLGNGREDLHRSSTGVWKGIHGVVVLGRFLSSVGDSLRGWGNVVGVGRRRGHG